MKPFPLRTAFSLTTALPTSRSALFHAAHPTASSHHWSHASAMSHHARSMFAREALQVLDEAPYFFVRQLPGEPHHAGTGRSILHHPEDFAFRTMAPESMVSEIAGRWIQLGSQRPITVPLFPWQLKQPPLP